MLIDHFSLAPGLSRKLDLKWVVPFIIEQVFSSVAYHIIVYAKTMGIFILFFLYFLLTWIPQASTFMPTSFISSYLTILHLSMKFRTS